MTASATKALLLLGILASLTACVPSRHVVTHTRTETTVITRTMTRPPSTSAAPMPTYDAPLPTTVAPLPPGATPAKGEVERRCPYIASSPDQNPTNVADIDGSHVYRTTVLTTLHPVGCRFYFYSSPYYAMVDIMPNRLSSSRLAYAAMIATAKRGTQLIAQRDIVPGVDAILYRTKFYGADGSRDWACAFAAGRTLVVVHTQRNDTSRNALLLARAVARRF